MKLYQHPFSPNCQKVVAVAHEVGVPLELATVEIFKGGARSPAMLAMNPNGKVPILEDGDFVLWESAAMLAYVAAKAGRVDLAPTTPRERAEVDRWNAWQGAHFAPAIRKVAFERIVKRLVGRGEPDEAVVKTGIEEFATTASVLEQSLGTKAHLCGGLTIADFNLAPYAALARFFTNRVTQALRAALVDANGRPGAGFYRLGEDGEGTFFALQVIEAKDGRIRVIDHFTTASSHAAFFAGGLARSLAATRG